MHFLDAREEGDQETKRHHRLSFFCFNCKVRKPGLSFAASFQKTKAALFTSEDPQRAHGIEMRAIQL